MLELITFRSVFARKLYIQLELRTTSKTAVVSLKKFDITTLTIYEHTFYLLKLFEAFCNPEFVKFGDYVRHPAFLRKRYPFKAMLQVLSVNTNLVESILKEV